MNSSVVGIFLSGLYQSIAKCKKKKDVCTSALEKTGGPGIARILGSKRIILVEELRTKISEITKDGSTEALLQILYGLYLILGVFGSCMF